MTPALRFAGVLKKFGSRTALRAFDLQVPAGSTFALVGPNGAGKTTAFSIACGFLRPDGGEISVLGAGPPDGARLKGRLSAMPQDAALARETTCLEHLLFFGRLQGLDAVAARREADRVLEELGLKDRARSKAKTLSHGMLRRLAVAQALVGRPELVMLDEPSSGLDPRHAHELRQVLRQRRDGRTTIVISSHNLPELETLCDHVAFIDQGVALRAGSMEAVTGRGEEIEIELAGGAAPLEDVRAVLPGDDVAWDDARRLLRITCRPRDGREVEDVIGVTLRVLLDRGARISGVRKGASLERKFLEMT